MLSHLGARIKTDGNEIRLEKSRIKGAKLKIPNDVSTAAFFIAHGLLGDGAVFEQCRRQSHEDGIYFAA